MGQDAIAGDRPARARIGRDLAGAVVSLGPLRIAELRELARRILPGFDEVEIDRVARRVGTDSAGIPLLAVELLRAVALGMDLRTISGAWPEPLKTLDQTLPGDLPTAVVSAIRVGFGRLSRKARDVLAAASILNDRVPPELLARALDLRGGRDRGARRAGVAPLAGERAARLRVHRAHRAADHRSRHAHPRAAPPHPRASRPGKLTAAPPSAALRPRLMGIQPRDQAGMVGGPELVSRTGEPVGRGVAYPQDLPRHFPAFLSIPDEHVVDPLGELLHRIGKIGGVAAGVAGLGPRRSGHTSMSPAPESTWCIGEPGTSFRSPKTTIGPVSPSAWASSAAWAARS